VSQAWGDAAHQLAAAHQMVMRCPMNASKTEATNVSKAVFFGNLMVM